MGPEIFAINKYFQKSTKQPLFFWSGLAKVQSFHQKPADTGFSGFLWLAPENPILRDYS